MTQSVRLSAAILLAGAGLVLMPAEVWAGNEPWEFEKGVDPETKNPGAAVYSIQYIGYREPILPKYTDLIGFGCVRDEPISGFTAVVSVVYDNTYPLGDYTVVSKVDNGRELRTVWQPNSNPRNLGLVLAGQQALDLALQIANGKHQLIIETPRGIIVNDLKNARKSIERMLRRCRLK